jgi:hypothetical protein
MPTVGLQVLRLNLQEREEKHTEDERWLEDVRDGVIEIALAFFWNNRIKDKIKQPSDEHCYWEFPGSYECENLVHYLLFTLF